MSDERGEDRRAEEARAADEAAWAQIVASLRQPDASVEPTWPAAENVAEHVEQPEPPEEPEPPDEPRQVIIWKGSVADIDAEIERAIPDEHFVPPEPPPLPRGDAITWAAWLAVLGSPLLLLVMTALGVTSALLVVVASAAFLGGFALLLTRMRAQRDPYDPDDGAVV